MTEPPVTQREFYDEMKELRSERDQGIEHAENFAASVARASANEVKKEVRWLIILSVGLNQFFNQFSLTEIAQAGATVAVVCAALLAKVLAVWFAR